MSDRSRYSARMRFNRYPILRALKSLVGWAKPVPAKPAPPAAAHLKIAPCRPVIILPRPDVSFHRWQAGFRLPLTHARDRKEIVFGLLGHVPAFPARLEGPESSVLSTVQPKRRRAAAVHMLRSAAYLRPIFCHNAGNRRSFGATASA